MDEVLAGGSLAADAGVFDEWGGGPEGFGRIAVAEQDFTAMGEAAADLLIGVLERDSGGECAVTAAVTAAGPTPARLVPFRGVRWISGAAGA
jgi:hypothetical protein